METLTTGAIVGIGELAIRFVREIRTQMNSNQKLNQDIIRTLLYQCRGTFPDYNAAIYEIGVANVLVQDSADKLIDEDLEMHDLTEIFKIKLVVFKKGSVSILRKLNSLNKWGNQFFPYLNYFKKIL
jgi:hypothetical protein